MATKAIGVCTTPDDDQARAVLQGGNLWEPGTTISVWLMDSPEYHDKVKTYLPIWGQFANLKFSFVEDTRADVRVTFAGANRVYNSICGMDAANQNRDSGQPTMFLGFDAGHTEDMFRGYVLHEFGHVLGLCHEHLSPGSDIEWDRQAVYNYFLSTNPNWTRETVDFNILDKLKYDGQSVQNYTAFDPQSIMIYAIPDGLASNFSHPDVNTDLSDMDKSFIGMVYPFDEVELKVGAAPVAGSFAKPGVMNSYRFTAATDATYRMETTGKTPNSITLMGPGSRGLWLEENHDKGTLANGMIEKDLGAGTYYFKVQPRLKDGTGDYQVSVKQV
jgi:hypothetical protein